MENRQESEANDDVGLATKLTGNTALQIKMFKIRLFKVMMSPKLNIYCTIYSS